MAYDNLFGYYIALVNSDADEHCLPGAAAEPLPFEDVVVFLETKIPNVH